MEFASARQVIDGPGLRIVLVEGLPSPWGQAAKTLFEIKGLEYLAAPWQAGETNDELVAWSGIESAPIVAWNDEKPIDGWLDILNLVERLAPEPALLPREPALRAQAVGLANAICGEYGIGWDRRLQLFQPVMASGDPPAGVVRMGAKYRYSDTDARSAGARVAATLTLLARQLEAQRERGSEFFIGEHLSAVDIYWTAFANLIDPLPAAQCPMNEQWRPLFVNRDPQIAAALGTRLLAYRDRIFDEYFRCPMEF